MDGLIPSVGDRIGVAVEMISQAQPAQMIAWDAVGRIMPLSNKIDWPATPSIMIRDKFGAAYGPWRVSKVSDTELSIPARYDVDAIALGDPMAEDPPSVVVAQDATIIRDYVVTMTEPQGMHSVTITATNYDKRAFIAPTDPLPEQDWVVADTTYPDWVIANDAAHGISEDVIIPWEPI